MTTTMRQRLLLVAGWLVAAIASGIVASGAVAVAGGQVLDRAQRPFTAAEVAALPVVAVGSSDDLEPHASGGLVPNAGEPTDDNTGGGTVNGSTGTGGSSASEPPTAPPFDPFSPNRDAGRIESNEGGQVSFAAVGDTLWLLWATPNPGFAVQRRFSTDALITVSFTSNRNVWLVKAVVRDGDLMVFSVADPLT
jgi:hypothetical protein